MVAAALFLHELPVTQTSGGITVHKETRNVETRNPDFESVEHSPKKALNAETDLELQNLLAAARNHAELEVRFDAISALGDVTYRGAGAALQSLLDDPLVVVREEAVESLSVLGGTDSIVGLGYAMSDASRTVRRLAIEGLSSLQSDEAIGTLALALSEDDPSLRELTIEELADIDSDNALVVLQSFLSDQNADVADLAIERINDRPFE